MKYRSADIFGGVEFETNEQQLWTISEPHICPKSLERVPDQELLDHIEKLEKSLSELKRGVKAFIKTRDEFDLDAVSDGLDSVEYDGLRLLKLVFIHGEIQQRRINERAAAARS